MKRFLAGLGTAWTVVGLTLLAMALINQLLVWVLPAPDQGALVVEGAVAPDNSVADAYEDAYWRKDYWAEHGDARGTEWRSYVYWRRTPFQGEMINVDLHGFRNGWQNADAKADAPQVWVFGGSLVWGTGVPDAFTLPSQLAFLYAKKDQEHPVRVLNFGESGYVSGQSRLAFAQALACGGQKPALVIFVDGANDVFAAFQAERAGIPQNEQRRATEFNSSQRPGTLLSAWFNRLDGVEHLRAWGAAAPNLLPVGDLAQSVVRSYLAYVDQMQALADANGIATAFVWQPHLFAKQQLSRDEQAIVNASFRRHRDLQLAADQSLAAALAESPRSLINLAALFADEPQPRFSDFVHVDDQGLETLARAIFAELPEILPVDDESAAESADTKTTNEPPSPLATSCQDLPVVEISE